MTELLPLRPASDIMQSKTLAAMQPSALSGVRALIRKMTKERWQISLKRLEIDEEGAGTVLYGIQTPSQSFTFIAFTFAPKTEGRTGRIIGRAWDMMCALTEGEASEAEVEHSRQELPKLYRGRATPQTLVWGRSNRSMRVFNVTLDALMKGNQPRIEDISNVCYLMRNTGLDGNGTFGTRAYAALGPDHALGGMLEAQLLCAYLMRELSCELVSEIARLKAPKTAAPLSREIRNYMGVGNGSALGLIFYVQKHPRLIDNWLRARETALAKAKNLQTSQIDWAELSALLHRAITFRKEDRMFYESFTSSAQIAQDLEEISEAIKEYRSDALPLDALTRRFEGQISPEALEILNSILIEQVADEAADLWASLKGEDKLELKASDKVADLIAEIEADYAWALNIDMSAPDAMDYIWYKSETAEEPRRGLRSEVEGARDLGLDLPGDVQRLLADLKTAPAAQYLSRFLMIHPQHRFIIQRIHGLRGLEYHTPYANIHSPNFVPIDLVRLMNVGIHGIDKTKDFLQRNLRGILFHGAPSPEEIGLGTLRQWFYPAEPK